MNQDGFSIGLPRVVHMTSNELSARVAHCLSLHDPRQKCLWVRQLAEDLAAGLIPIDRQRAIPDYDAVGVPAKPLLVVPSALPGRRLGGREGHAALIHSVAHIEFTAINLALDAAQRFRGLPEDYYRDWVAVAAEEAVHFGLIADHLSQLGFQYGDFPAHAGMWQIAQQTAHDVMVRMAVVPRGLEARGLDVTPGMIQRLEGIGDHPGATILRRILADEVGHVAVGTRWFNWLCRERELDPVNTFLTTSLQYLGRPRSPAFHLEARRRAGFQEQELAGLRNQAQANPGDAAR